MYLSIEECWNDWWRWVEFCNSYEFCPDEIVIVGESGHYWSWICAKCGQTSAYMTWSQVDAPDVIVCNVDKKCGGVMAPYLYLPQKKEVTILTTEDFWNNWWKLCDPLDLFQMHSGSKSITEEALAA